MFILTEGSTARAKAMSQAWEGTDESPEADSVQEIEKLQKLFGLDFPLQSSFYSVNSSRKDSLSSGEYLRALGAATYRSNGNLPIDGLARGLLSKALDETTIYLVRSGRFKRRKTEALFDEFIWILNESSCWFSSNGELMEREFLISSSARNLNERLVFTAKPNSSNQEHIELITGLKEVGPGRSARVSDGIFRNHIQRIFDDQIRRYELAREYASAPSSKGFPAVLRAEIKRSLDSVGISNGSYSREGFSSGKFPYRFTKADVRGSSAMLLFERCDNCRSVARLFIENGNFIQRKEGQQLTQELIGPWHASICRPRGDLRRGFEPQLWEEDWIRLA